MRDVRKDLLAGLVVAIVALPLSMALAIAAGVAPERGLYTAIVGGAAIALLGGSRFQVSGPTAAFVAILLPIVQHHGLGGLMLATAMAGVMMFLLGAFRLGRFIQFVPYPVVTGFTAGIALVIATGQVGTFLGMQGVRTVPHWHQAVLELLRCAPTVHALDFAIGVATLVLLLVLPRRWPQVPGPIVAIGLTTLVAYGLHEAGIGNVVTIAQKFSYTAANGSVVPGLPSWPPHWCWPWEMPGADGAPLVLSLAHLRELLLSAITIALLGAIASLLSAVAADGMAGTRHDPDAELMAQGLGNMLSPFFGGIAATGGIARTTTNVRSGARSPIAAIVHSGCLLLAILLFAPWLGLMPMSALAALLLVVAWRMCDLRHVARMLRTAPRGDVLVMGACFFLTVAFDMVVGVVTGMLLASLLFLRRMAELTGIQLVRENHPDLRMPIPKGVLVYEIEGPLFFGAAERAMNALHSIGRRDVVVVLDLDGVQTIDSTGVVNLQSALARLRASGVRVVLTGIRANVYDVLQRASLAADEASLFIRPSLRDGVAFAGTLTPSVPQA